MFFQSQYVDDHSLTMIDFVDWLSSKQGERACVCVFFLSSFWVSVGAYHIHYVCFGAPFVQVLLIKICFFLSEKTLVCQLTILRCASCFISQSFQLDLQCISRFFFSYLLNFDSELFQTYGCELFQPNFKQFVPLIAIRIQTFENN